MPIVVGSVVLEPPPTSPPAELPEIGRAHATYIDPRGGVWPLTDPARGWFTLAAGVSGLGAAPVELASDPHPRGGERLRHVQPQARSIVWPLHVYGADHTEFTARWRALARAFTDTLRYGPGILEIARPDGGRRRISVYYQGGFEGQAQEGYSRTDDSAILALWCEDPYFYDPDPITEHRESGAGVDFFVPYPSVSSSQVLGDTTLTNPGDVVAWPVWTITGPASAVTFTHGGTAESFTLDPNAAAVGHGNLLAGEQVSIRTDPPQVRYQNGDNWVGALNWPGAVLWGLAPGGNEVTFTLSGSTTGSAVDVAFLPRYETA
jgi:hypothetical protein